MEVQAGLPIGFTKLLTQISVGKEVLFHTTTPDKSAELIYYKDGTVKMLPFGERGGEGEKKTLDDFNSDLADFKKGETRETLISRLKAKYGTKIDPNDIARKVYETYSDEVAKSIQRGI